MTQILHDGAAGVLLWDATNALLWTAETGPTVVDTTDVNTASIGELASLFTVLQLSEVDAISMAESAAITLQSLSAEDATIVLEDVAAILATISFTDIASLAFGESGQILAINGLVESPTLSISEQATVASFLIMTDVGGVSCVDVASVAVVGLTVVDVSDSASLSLDEGTPTVVQLAPSAVTFTGQMLNIGSFGQRGN